MGTNYNSILTSCYATGSINGESRVGGLVGSNGYGMLAFSYATGLVAATGSDVGGLVGYNYGEISSCFWDIETSNQTTSAGGTGEITVEMQTLSTFTDVGWDFVGETANGIEDTWWIDEGNGYPILRWQLPNTAPVANAGDDQLAHAWIDGFAEVQLDGTDSYDEDGDVLEYYWYDGNDLIATGAEPNVVLPVGEHVIDLIVNDGIEDSEPDSCVVTVIEPVETTGRMLPGVINLKVNRDQINGRIEFAGEEMPVLDPNEPMLLLVSDAEIQAAEQKLVYCEEEIAWYLMGSFDSAAVIENLPLNTTAKQSLTVPPAEAEITLVARFEAGQWVYGTDMVKVK